MTREEKITRITEEIIALQKKVQQLREKEQQLRDEREAEKLAIRRDQLKTHTGNAVKYTSYLRIGASEAHKRVMGKVGTLEKVLRDYAIVNFGADLGKWHLELKWLEPVDEHQA